MSQTPNPSVEAKASTPALPGFPRWAGGIIAAAGLLIIASWYAHWEAILQLVPNTAPMQFNTALCFVLSGTGLLLLTTPRKIVTTCLGGIVALLGLVPSLEYVLHRDFGVDEVFHQPYFQVATIHPGRMSPMAALCFVLIGVSLVLAGLRPARPRRLAGAGLLACVVAVNGAVSLLGFFTGIDSAYGWGAYTRIAVNSAALYLLFGLGLLAWALRTAREVKSEFRHWLPMTASLALMVLIAFVSTASFTQLQDSAEVRQHSSQVVASAQALLDNLNETERGMRLSLLTGQPEALEPYQTGTKNLPILLGRLLALTRDNPSQHRRLAVLSGEIDDVTAHARKLLAAKAASGLPAAIELDATGTGLALMNRARADLLAFSHEAERLQKDSAAILRADLPNTKGYLDDSATIAQADFHDSKRLLLMGCGLAAVLLVYANLMAYREVSRRRQAEAQSLKLVAELRESLGHVKTLSGLIPICGWCKSVRSDTGYWQSVEQYVRARTDATFTHGLCPTCSEKMKADIVKANS